MTEGVENTPVGQESKVDYFPGANAHAPRIAGTAARTPGSFINRYFDEVYVINLQHQTTNRLKIAQQLQAHGIKFKLFEAVNGYAGKPLEKYKTYQKRQLGDLKRYPQYSEREKKRGKPYIESAGAVGYIYTYINLMRDAKKNGYHRFLVLEDDVLLAGNFEAMFKSFVGNIHENWKILLLGASQYDINIAAIGKRGYYLPRMDTYGTFAAAFDASIIDQVVEAISAFEAPVDNLPMGEMYERYLNRCFVAFPNMVMADVSDSTIREKRCQHSHAKKMKWDMTLFDYPLDKPSISIIVTSLENLKYYSGFSRSQDMPFDLRLFFNSTDGIRPIHNVEVLNDRGINAFQPLPNAISVPETNYLALIGEAEILTEIDILGFIEYKLGIKDKNLSVLREVKNTPSDIVKERVSVIIPTYKRCQDLEKALQSVVLQDYHDIEVLVVSDNGFDSEFSKKTREVVLSFMGINPHCNIRLLEHAVNRNGSAARNTGIINSTGEYICFLDDDDAYLQGRLSKSIAELKKTDKKTGAVYCGFLGWNSPENNQERYRSGDLTRNILLLDYEGHYLHTNTATYKRAAILKNNGFDESYRRHQDLEFNLRFFQHYQIGVIKECLVRLRLEPCDMNKLFGINMSNLKVKFLSQFKPIIDMFDADTQERIYENHYSELQGYTKNAKPSSPVLENSNSVNIDGLINEARNHVINRQYLEALNKTMTVLATDEKHLVAYQIAEQAAIELGEFELAKNFFLLQPSPVYPAEARAQAKSQVLPPQFVLPPIIGAGNDYRHILERVAIFKASGEVYTKTVSVIIPAYNRQALLANTLAAMTHQTYPKFLTEIIVVDDGSNDEIFAVIKKYENTLNLRYVRQDDQGFRAAAARNMGMKLASGEAIVLLDADILPLPHTLENYMQVLHVSTQCVLLGQRRYVDTSAITDNAILADITVAINLPDINPDNDVAVQRDSKGDASDWRFAEYAKTDNLINDLWPFTKSVTCSMAFSRELMLQAGYMDEAFNAWGGEDTEYGYRLYNVGAYFIPMLDNIFLHQEPLVKKPATSGNSGDKSFRAKGLETTRPLLINKCPAPVIRRASSGKLFDVPKVSIYIPAYNAARYIVETVQSCLAQTYDDLEVVICNDGSTDHTLYLIEKNFSGNPKVRWVSQSNGGIGKATNSAISYCRGMYIGQLDADDLLKPEAVQSCVAVLDSTDVDAVYSDFDYVDENGAYARNGWCAGEVSREWVMANAPVTPFRMFRKRVWARTSGCNLNIKNAVDFDLWSKISEVGHIKHLHKILYSYRWHGTNTSIVDRKVQENNHLKVVADGLMRRGLGQFWKVKSVDNPLNPRELKIVPVTTPAPVLPQDVIFLIPACAKYFDKKKAVQNTWARELGKVGFRYWFLEGNPQLSAPLIKDDTLYVPCDDTYEYLLLKLLLGYQFLYRTMAFSHIYKIDDDCLPNLVRITNDILPQLAGQQYAGGSIQAKGSTIDHNWHIGKCADRRFEKPFPLNKLDFAFARGGYGYFLRKDVLPLLFGQIGNFKQECERYQYTFEDVRIAATLHEHSISVHALEKYHTSGFQGGNLGKHTLIYDLRSMDEYYALIDGYARAK